MTTADAPVLRRAQIAWAVVWTVGAVMCGWRLADTDLAFATELGLYGPLVIDALVILLALPALALATSTARFVGAAPLAVVGVYWVVNAVACIGLAVFDISRLATVGYWIYTPILAVWPLAWAALAATVPISALRSRGMAVAFVSACATCCYFAVAGVSVTHALMVLLSE